jgi:hypothetical protein
MSVQGKKIENMFDTCFHMRYGEMRHNRGPFLRLLKEILDSYYEKLKTKIDYKYVEKIRIISVDCKYWLS